MKSFKFTTIVVIFLWTNLADCKTRTDQSLKKAHLKPTKGPKNILDTFKSLPQDDLEFIKQLDKQFNKFGNNVKIKLQKVNQTSTSSSGKNHKRTIDGSLGYGYQHPNQNDQQSMYTFLKPKYEVYPYSQHDIPPSPHYQHQQQPFHYLRHYPTALVEGDANYYDKQPQQHTSVEIQPSHSYEIKQTDHGYKTIYHGNGDHGSPEYNGHGDVSSGEPVPVIVLRVPGPSKYAAHLQALLQQYLEVRAAQYIQSLQEQEAHGVDTSQPIQHGLEPDLSAYSGLPILPYGSHQAYLPAQMYIQPINPVQQYFPQHSLPNPYANAHIAQPIEIEDDHSAVTPSPADYYSTHAAHSTSSDESDQHTAVVHPTAYSYQNIHEDQPQQQQHYEQPTVHDGNEEAVYGPPNHQSESDAHSGQLLTNENYPDDQHTRVIFKTSTEPPYTSDHLEPQPYLPGPVNTYRAPLVYHKLEQYYNPHNDESDVSAGYDENASPIGSSTPYASTVAITQRPAVLPHNYHAQAPENQQTHYDENQGYEYPAPTETPDNFLYKRNSSKKRQSIKREDQYKKFTNLANRMKSRMKAAARHTDPLQA